MEKASVEFTTFDEHGIEISYNRRLKKFVIEGWFNYIEQMDRFEISLEELLKALAIPIEDVRTAYSIDCWGNKVKNPGGKKKDKIVYKYKRKTPKLFMYRREDKKPTYDLVCQWSECGKTFTTTDKKRKYCCQECVKAWFKWQSQSGVSAEKAKATRIRRKEINKKISDGVKRKLKNEL